jgi:protein involved in polysaccharide export with SLBB domain
VPLDSTYLLERAAKRDYLGPPGLSFPTTGAPDVLLKPYDNVLIFRQPDWELQRVVNIYGEVRFPGTYALTNKEERLSDIVARAGGLTSRAYADGIVFNRVQGNIGRVGVELSAALRDRKSHDNLILRDGDDITIPPFNAVVSIRGAVNLPSSVAYVPGKGIDYYIGAAGGPSRTADEGRAYVVQPGGKLEAVKRRLWVWESMPRPRPGGIVTVPESDPEAGKNRVALAGTIAQVLASTVAILIAIRR